MKKYSQVIMLCGIGLLAGCQRTQTPLNNVKPFTMALNNDSNYQPLLTGIPQTCGMRSGRVFLEPGKDCGEHTTGEHEEMLVFLSGSVMVLLEHNYELPVASGAIAYISPYTRHNVKNTAKEPLVYIYCVSPIHESFHQEEHHH